MTFKRIISCIFLLMLVLNLANAQAPVRSKVSERGASKGRITSGRSKMNERARMVGTTMDLGAIPEDNRKYVEDRMKELEQAMEERNWSSEDTAWEMVSKENTIQAYRTYLARFPYGAHSVEATKRLVDLEVNETFRNSHNSLPNMTKVVDEPNSPTSTIMIQNSTGMILTVMYSGEDSRSITLRPNEIGMVTLKNGSYRIAASVPPAYVRPFAGSEILTGGTYEVGYIITTK